MISRPMTDEEIAATDRLFAEKNAMPKHVPITNEEQNARRGDIAELSDKIDAIDAKLTAVLKSVDEIIEQAKPAFEQLMNSPILAMLSGGKKRG